MNKVLEGSHNLEITNINLEPEVRGGGSDTTAESFRSKHDRVTAPFDVLPG